MDPQGKTCSFRILSRSAGRRNDRGLSRFSRRQQRCYARVLDRRENGTVPLGLRDGGQVHVFGQPFVRKMRLLAEIWASPQPNGGGGRELTRVAQSARIELSEPEQDLSPSGVRPGFRVPGFTIHLSLFRERARWPRVPPIFDPRGGRQPRRRLPAPTVRRPASECLSSTTLRPSSPIARRSLLRRRRIRLAGFSRGG